MSPSQKIEKITQSSARTRGWKKSIQAKSSITSSENGTKIYVFCRNLKWTLFLCVKSVAAFAIIDQARK